MPVVSSIPNHLFIRILQKMNIVTWMRMRRTCKALFDFVVQEHHQFHFTHGKRKNAYLKYTTRAEEEGIFFRFDQDFYVFIKGTNIVEQNSMVKVDKTDLAGIVFENIIVAPFDGDIYSDEDWQEFSRTLNSFLQEVPLRSTVLRIALELEYSTAIARLFPSAEILFIYMNPNLMKESSLPPVTRNRERDDMWTYFVEPSKVLEIMEQSEYTHFTGIRIGMGSIGKDLLPLVRRFDYLRIHENFSISNYDTPTYVYQLLKSISNGSYDLGTGKHIYLDYFALRADRVVNGKLLHFWELDGIGGREVWKKNTLAVGLECSKGIFIETPHYVAFLTFQGSVRPDDNAIYQVIFEIDIRSEFNAEAIVQLLTEGFPCLKKKSKSECVALVKEKNWKELEKHVVYAIDHPAAFGSDE